MRYTMQVIETRTAVVEYIVDAESIDQALIKAVIGDTEDEIDNRNEKVINRVIYSTPKLESEAAA